MSKSHNSKTMLSRFKFFDITLAETYYIVNVKVFTFGNCLEFILTLRSSEVDTMLKTYATVTNAKVCTCRFELVGSPCVRIAQSAQEFICGYTTETALCISRSLILNGVGEYDKFSRC